MLEGSVRKAGNRVRITAQLLDSTTGHHVWAERYDRELADTFAVQDDITEQVVAAIQPQLYATEGCLRAKRKPPENFDAWECVVRALGLLNSRAKADILAARVLLNKAVLLDPSYAKAHSLLSFATTLGVHMGWDKIEDTRGVASAAAHQALQLDADDPWAHVALGYVLVLLERASVDAIPITKRRWHSIPTLPSRIGFSDSRFAISGVATRHSCMATWQRASVRTTYLLAAMPA